MTEEERILWLKIRKKQVLGLQFYRQKPIGKFIVDFYCPQIKLVIEVDGSQHYEEEGEQKDKDRDRYLQSSGLRVLRFSNYDIRSSLENVVDHIYNIAEKHKKKSPSYPPFAKWEGNTMKFTGTTITGAGRGKKLGFPTLNIKLSSEEYEEGVFAVRGELNGKSFEGVAHFGSRPTFEDTNLSVEIHIFDFAQNVKEGNEMEFETVGERIRDVRKFDLQEELQNQIQRDIQKAKKLLGIYK